MAVLLDLSVRLGCLQFFACNYSVPCAIICLKEVMNEKNNMILRLYTKSKKSGNYYVCQWTWGETELFGRSFK